MRIVPFACPCGVVCVLTIIVSHCLVQPVCAECEKEEATRYCLMCTDKYCDQCYKVAHATGKRKQHKFEPLGLARCAECEKTKAIWHCEQCDDPYCKRCFMLIHKKGNKAKHTYTSVEEAQALGVQPENAVMFGEEQGYGSDNYVEDIDDGGGAQWETQSDWDTTAYEEEPLPDEVNPYEAEVWGTEGAVGGLDTTAGGEGEANADADFAAADAAWEEEQKEPGAYGGEETGAEGYASDAAALDGYATADMGGGGAEAAEEAALDMGQSAAEVGEWEEFFDDEAGIPYYYNATTEESTYDRPASLGIAVVAADEEQEVVAAEGGQEGEEGAATGAEEEAVEWFEYFDDEENLPYWYNPSTGDTTWENPLG